MVPSDAFLSRYAPLRPVAGCGDLIAHQALDVFALWEAWERECGHVCDVPYWATVWPGGLALARYVLAHRDLVAGSHVLDLGCGGGIVALASVRAGARHVVANDIDPVAIRIAGRNAAANGEMLELDTRDLLASESEDDVDVVLVGDLFYQRSVSARMVEFLTRRRDRGALVLIGDARRSYAPRDGIDVLQSEQVPVDPALEGTAEREVRLLRL